MPSVQRVVGEAIIIRHGEDVPFRDRERQIARRREASPLLFDVCDRQSALSDDFARFGQRVLVDDDQLVGGARLASRSPPCRYARLPDGRTSRSRPKGATPSSPLIPDFPSDA